jgi:hypothetical protein
VCVYIQNITFGYGRSSESAVTIKHAQSLLHYSSGKDFAKVQFSSWKSKVLPSPATFTLPVSPEGGQKIRSDKRVIELRSFSTGKEIINRIKRQFRE